VTYVNVTDHRSMALDARRNAAYYQALREIIEPTSVVLDLGAGTGVLGLIAARLGARRVYLVEPQDIVLLAQEAVRANGFDDRVQCLQGRIEEIELPERVDVIVSVLTGNFLLSEDLLHTLFHARDRYLKPGGALIPAAAAMEAVPVAAPSLHAREIAGWSTPQHGVDLSAARVYAANSVFFRMPEMRSLQQLAEPQVLGTVDFGHGAYEGVCSEVSYEITQSGPCHGWLGWFRMKLGDRWLSTSPYEEPLHWSPAFLPLDPPLVFERGERVTFTLARPAFGDWTWRVHSEQGSQQHSTLLASPMNAVTLERTTPRYRPTLGADGVAVRHVLSLCTGTASVEDMTESLLEAYPDRYATRAQALRFVQQVVWRYER